MEILANTRRVVAAVMGGSGVEPGSVVALAITNQRETIVAWDGRSGEPVYRAIVWQDERGTPYCEALRNEENTKLVRSRTGLTIDSYFSASKLQWLIEHVEEARRSAEKGHLLCGTIDTWLIWNLTGGAEFATDYSNASRTLLFDIGRLQWDEGLRGLFSVADVRLPHVRPADASFGAASIEGVGPRLPIVGVMGDSHAALFGQGGFNAGVGKATYGTGSSIMLNVGTTPLSPPPGIVTSIAWGFGGTVDYVFEANIHSTGDTLRWVRDELGLFDTYAEAEKMAASLETNNGVYLVPAFSGLGAPHWVHGVRALIAGLSRGTGRVEIVRAALESIGYQIYDVVERMTSEGDIGELTLRVDGAPASNRFLMQFQADILGATIEVASIPEVSARGVAFAAGLARGVWDTRGELAVICAPAQRYDPKMSVDKRQMLLDGWHHALDQAVLGSGPEPTV